MTRGAQMRVAAAPALSRCQSCAAAGKACVDQNRIVAFLTRGYPRAGSPPVPWRSGGRVTLARRRHGRGGTRQDIAVPSSNGRAACREAVGQRSHCPCSLHTRGCRHRRFNRVWARDSRNSYFKARSQPDSQNQKSKLRQVQVFRFGPSQISIQIAKQLVPAVPIRILVPIWCPQGTIHRGQGTS